MRVIQEGRLRRHSDGSITIHWDAQIDTGSYIVTFDVNSDITVAQLFLDLATHQRRVNLRNKVAGNRESFE